MSRGLSLALLALLAWSLALRVWLGTPNPTLGRFQDERFGVMNIRALLVEDTIRPANGFHPGLSYLPQAAVLAGAEALGVRIFEGSIMTPAGYLICRFLQAVLGALSLYLTFRIGRRMFSPGVGVLAALLLAAVPWHLRQSVIYKPDILLVVASLFAFDRALAAAANPAWRRYLAAGSAIGLGLASKFNAGPIALPLITAALSGGGWRDRKAWGRLALAGAVSVAILLLFTPFLVLDWDLYEKDFSRTLRDYERKGAGVSHLHVLWHGVRSLVSWSFHGPVVGIAALLGLALVARRDLGTRMLASYVIGYSLVYALSTRNPSPHNWLPLVPFTSLAAAWLLVRLRERLPRPARHPAFAAVLILLLTWPVNAYTYRHSVPTTHELAGRYLKERLPLQGRTVIFERGDARAEVLGGRYRAFLQETPRLDGLPPGRVEQADAVLFRADRLEGEGADFYRSLSAGGGETVRFSAAPFRAQGTGLVMVVRPWKPIGELVPVPVVPQDARRARFEGRLPEGVLSLEIVLPHRWKPEWLRQVRVHGQPVEWDTGGLERRRRRIVTRRFQVAGPAEPVEIVLSRPMSVRKELEVRFRRWER